MKKDAIRWSGGAEKEGQLEELENDQNVSLEAPLGRKREGRYMSCKREDSKGDARGGAKRLLEKSMSIRAIEFLWLSVEEEQIEEHKRLGRRARKRYLVRC